MGHDPGHEMKARMRADLRAALKERRTNEADLLRALIAAIDNAEAPPLPVSRGMVDRHHFREGTAEVERLLLSRAQVRAILLAEIRERENAAAEMNRLARRDRSDALRAEALIAKRYIA